MNGITMNLQADHLIRLALQEDITSEDITCLLYTSDAADEY